ncbi:MAG TPA: amidohydrolase family protein [Gemmatimonadales bacterium]|jgi:imidazolonepropionase-like amidohydrolase|nr:amidohydrolase family protein [Gemmatimonadales bacterium]
MLGLALLFLSTAPRTPDTTSYVVLNHGRQAGELRVVTRGDTTIVRYHHVDRNRGPRSETRYLIRNGVVAGGETWQLPLYGPEPNPLGRPADRFEILRDSVRWRAGDSARSTPLTPATWYRLRSFTPFDQALLARFLLSRPDRTAQLLPSGSAKLELVADTSLRTPAGPARVRLAMLRGPSGPPSAVWLDEGGALFAGGLDWFIAVRPQHRELLPALRAIELRFRNADGEALARKLAPPPAPTLAIVGGDLFDSERGIVLPAQTVLIRGERIVAVGPADSLKVPGGASIVNAAGKTVMPGMWDMHTHLFHTSQSSSGPTQLAGGITTIRDLASDIDVAVSHRERAATGGILSPRIILAGFLEGPGRWAGPTEVIVRSEEEALAWIARYDSLGYRQIKLYNLLQQDLVPAIAAETHRRGMRLSGHVPRGLSTAAAVRLGFDEINHAAFLFSTFFPDSLYLPMRAYSAVAAAVAPNIEVDGPELSALLALFRERGTVVDGTFNLWLREGTDSVSRKANANWLRLIKRLDEAGVTLVPGTDGSNYNTELENYERAGIPAAKVLQIATIVPARVMRQAQDYGSIAAGKVADLFLVDGKPAERVADLRKVERVVRAGRVYDPKALRAALSNR